MLGLRPLPARVTAALPLKVAIPLLAASFACASYLTIQVMDLPGHAHRNREKNGSWEETPLLGRQRPQLPPLTQFEEEVQTTFTPMAWLHAVVKMAAGGSEQCTLGSSVSCSAHAPCSVCICQLRRMCCSCAGDSAQVLPADHPASRAAEAMLRELLVAAGDLIDERHGADSAVATRFRVRMAEHRVPICVYRCKDKTFGGFAGPAGIAIHEGSLTIGTVAHEVAHVVLRHSAEKQCSMEGPAHSRATWGLASLGWAAASRPAGWPLLPALTALSLVKGTILNDKTGGWPRTQSFLLST